VDSSTWFDEIVSNHHAACDPLMYDLTVAGTRNFNTTFGICGSDTFHHAGLSSMGGVPHPATCSTATNRAPS
jgi:hypothetical protein